MDARPYVGLTLAVERRGRTVLVTLAGDVDLSTVAQLRTVLRDVLADGCDQLVVDLAGVLFIESVGLGALISAYKRARVLRTDLVLWRPSPVVNRVLGVTGLTRVFQIELRSEVDPRDASALDPGVPQTENA